MVAFVSSFVVAIILGIIPLLWARRRPVDAPLTWGQAMVAAVYVFFSFLWIYGMVPHQWMGLADNTFQWRPDQILLGPDNGFIHIPFTFNRQHLRDIILVVIYGFFFTCHVGEWWLWQRRGKRRTKSPARRSPFGRPVIRRS